MVLLEEKFLKMREILKNIKKFKPFDWILIGLTFILVLIFTFVFFRNSIYKVVTIEVTQESTYAWEVWDASGSKMWFSDLFHKGMKERDGLGNVKAELLDTFSYEKTPARITVYLTTKLRVVYNRASNTYTYKGTPVLIGSKIKVNFDNLLVEGLITDIEGVSDKREKRLITVEAQIREENSTYLETSGTKAYIADAIKVGEEIKDNNGNTIIKIIDKKVEPAQRVVVTSDGRAMLRVDPVRKDIYLTLEINALKIGERYFLLNDIPIVIDYSLPINTPHLSLFPVVTKFISIQR
ncbi:hypothetical protein A3E15_02845 [Candidatus Woesebacteria bacterium RIFCSPHIGHO2_12_FULL_42_9]|uniref:Uncharacterized protein n=2 Tax=Candidatus Woeseibacteriota TaxID=1752722 RepID=A0A1F8ASK9_9BACT|nr:MAG: hypothetical protein A3E15_02845 [Candidatus Woesebacteria bacterium RIFCSPHIGHO2_12_FULL_42_9]